MSNKGFFITGTDTEIGKTCITAGLTVALQNAGLRVAPIKSLAAGQFQDGEGRWHPVGCAHCNQTGYKGRTGIYELLVTDDAIRALVHNRAAESELIAAATAQGLRSMRADGQRLITEGITSEAEVLSVTRD